MAATALAQEKVWLDKSSYDKAERLHHEKLAKVLPQKIMDLNNITVNPKEEVEPLKSSLKSSKNSKKSKKISFQENITSDIWSQNIVDNNSISTKSASKTSKNSKKNNKTKEEVMPEAKKIVEPFNNNGLKNEDSNNIPNVNTNTKKNKAKEAKEKKNKADKKTRNLEEDKNNQENKEQLSSQGSQPSICSISPAGGSLANEVAKARQHIKQSLQCMDGIAALAGISDKDLASRLVSLEKENQDLRNIVQELKNVVMKLDSRVKDLEVKAAPYLGQVPNLQICPQKSQSPKEKAAPKKEEDERKADPKEEEDDDLDLFGSDSEGEDAEAAKLREERLAAYAAKKSKKPALIAKSNIILDIKPWDDETDMKAMEAEVRKITADGLLWGAAKLAPVAYNIKKLQISSVVEDDKVSVDWLVEKIQEIEDYVQSVDIAAFNKI